MLKIYLPWVENMLDTPNYLMYYYFYNFTTYMQMCHELEMVVFKKGFSDVITLQKALTIFTCQGKQSLIALMKLHLRRSNGGLGIPDHRVYNIACLLRHALDWLSNHPKYTSTGLGSEMMTP